MKWNDDKGDTCEKKNIVCLLHNSQTFHLKLLQKWISSKAVQGSTALVCVEDIGKKSTKYSEVWKK